MSDRPELIVGRAGRDDPDFPAVGTVRYELHKALDQRRVCVKRSEVIGIFESRDEARQWMIDTTDDRKARDGT